MVVKGGRIYSVATNRYKTCPMDFPSDLLNENQAYIGVHAEEAALRMVNPDVLRGSTVVVVRLDSSGEPALSKPCPNCERILAEAGVRKVMYTV